MQRASRIFDQVGPLDPGPYPQVADGELVAVSKPTFPDFVPAVPELLRVGSERFGDRDCVVTPDSRITYAELETRSRKLAARLVAAGVAKSSRVGLLFPNGPNWVVAWAAAARIGAVAIPVNTFYTGPELGRFLRHADVRGLRALARAACAGEPEARARSVRIVVDVDPVSM